MASTEDLFEAISDNNPDLLLQLLNDPRNGIEVNERDKAHGLQTLLMRACHLHVTTEQRAAILDSTMLLGPNVNLLDGGGRSCLCHACISEKMEVVELLASCPETDPNIADSDGNTALLYAVRSRNPTVVSRLIELFLLRGLDVNHVNFKGKQALILCKAPTLGVDYRFNHDMTGSNQSSKVDWKGIYVM
jgi:hypothetical protein